MSQADVRRSKKVWSLLTSGFEGMSVRQLEYVNLDRRPDEEEVIRRSGRQNADSALKSVLAVELERPNSRPLTWTFTRTWANPVLLEMGEDIRAGRPLKKPSKTERAGTSQRTKNAKENTTTSRVLTSRSAEVSDSEGSEWLPPGKRRRGGGRQGKKLSKANRQRIERGTSAAETTA